MIDASLNEEIKHIEHILEILKLYNDLIENGNCNNCYNKECEWKPKVGQRVRYNCPHFEKWRPEE